ncbi:Zinc finger MYM-type protein 6 [Eumeta japonica]|uniref:Zinc finger MYM-type protein 6 n=1 Tax=Eumeta variegata TaxID=151549 RepID=A0A4C1UMI5_EUMVA|nr:Zinc finger MYM-type protein 6 [Eumeta japonica]
MGQILSTRNRQACMKRLMDVSEAREISKDLTMWKSSLCLPFGEIGVTLYYYKSTSLQSVSFHIKGHITESTTLAQGASRAAGDRRCLNDDEIQGWTCSSRHKACDVILRVGGLVIAAHKRSQPRGSHQCVSGLCVATRTSVVRMNGAIERKWVDGGVSVPPELSLPARGAKAVTPVFSKSGKPHTIGEQLILPAVEEALKTVLYKSSFDMLKRIPLSNNTVQKRIDEMSSDVESFLCDYLRTTHFSIQLDESTLPGNEALLLAYVRFVMGEEIHEELLFAKTLYQRFEDILSMEIPPWIISPFDETEVENVILQEELLELSTNEELKVTFKRGYQKFWLQAEISEKYPELWGIEQKLLIAFPSSYLVEKGTNTVVSVFPSDRLMKTLRDLKFNSRPGAIYVSDVCATE